MISSSVIEGEEMHQKVRCSLTCVTGRCVCRGTAARRLRERCDVMKRPLEHRTCLQSKFASWLGVVRVRKIFPMPWFDLALDVCFAASEMACAETKRLLICNATRRCTGNPSSFTSCILPVPAVYNRQRRSLQRKTGKPCRQATV